MNKRDSRPSHPKSTRKFKQPDEEQQPVPEALERLAKINGLQAVSALFRNDPERIMRFYYEERLKNQVGGFCAQMARMRRPYRMLSADEMTKVAGTVLHGGIVAAAKFRTISDFDVEEALQWENEPLLILDGVGNPHNVGAIARTMAFFNMERLILSDHPGQAGLSDAAHRVAEGGLEMVEVYKAEGLPQVLKRLQKKYRVIGTTLSDQASPIADLPDDDRPLAMVLGHEADGLPQATLQACEKLITIPGSGKVQSLNVSVSAAILIYEMSIRRKIKAAR